MAVVSTKLMVLPSFLPAAEIIPLTGLYTTMSPSFRTT